MKTIIIGFGYRARNGKDTAAKAIIDARGDKFRIGWYPFAKALKDEYTEACREAGGAFELIQKLRLTHNLPQWVQYEVGAETTDPLCPFGKQRTLLQWWGTEYRRAQDPFYWVRKTGEAIAKDKPQFALITDMRFPNEAFFVKANEGYTVKVERHGFVDALAGNHPTETVLSSYNFDATITVLDGEVEQLKKDAVELFDMIVSWESVPEYKTEDFTEEAFITQG